MIAPEGAITDTGVDAAQGHVPRWQPDTGAFKDGKINVQGTYTHANGDTYTGEWKDGNRNGQGTLTVAHGPPITGEWKDGVPAP